MAPYIFCDNCGVEVPYEDVNRSEDCRRGTGCLSLCHHCYTEVGNVYLIKRSRDIRFKGDVSQAEYENLREGYDALVAELGQLRGTLAKEQASKRGLTYILAETQSAKNDIAGKLAYLQRTHRTILNDYHGVTDERNTIGDELTDLQGLYQKAVVELAKANYNVDKYHKDYQKVVAERDRLDTNLRRLHADYLAMTGERNGFKDKLTLLQGEHEALEKAHTAMVAVYKKDKNYLQKRYHEVVSKWNETQKELTAFAGKLACLEGICQRTVKAKLEAEEPFKPGDRVRSVGLFRPNELGTVKGSDTTSSEFDYKVHLDSSANDCMTYSFRANELELVQPETKTTREQLAEVGRQRARELKVGDRVRVCTPVLTREGKIETETFNGLGGKEGVIVRLKESEARVAFDCGLGTFGIFFFNLIQL